MTLLSTRRSALLVGPKGDPGPDGPPGAQGPSGLSGSWGPRITATVYQLVQGTSQFALVDTTTNTNVTVRLPANPVDGDVAIIKWGFGAGGNSLTVSASSLEKPNAIGTFGTTGTLASVGASVRFKWSFPESVWFIW